jgi:hypothetical protein
LFVCFRVVGVGGGGGGGLPSLYHVHVGASHNCTRVRITNSINIAAG